MSESADPLSPSPDNPEKKSTGNAHLADQNLLFGVLALQVRFITERDLITALVQWVDNKQQSLEAILIQQGKLNADRAIAVQTLVRVHLQDHQGDWQASLRATGIDRERLLMPVQDDELAASMRQLPSAAAADAEKKAPVARDRSDFETQSYRRNPANASTGEGSRYRIVRHHRDGGQGRVFEAKDIELHRRVALKEPRPDRNDDQTHHRLVLEAEITGGLEHPGVVPIYGLNRHPDGRPYYTMKFIEGTTFWDEIKQFHSSAATAKSALDQSLQFRQLLQRFVAICNTVAYAHSRRVIHRDLKPQNVMLGKFGETLVVDWGMAKTEVAITPTLSSPAEAEGDERTLRPASGSSIDATSIAAIVGTPRWMSPEQAAGRVDELGPASDIYALGSILYFLLVGQSPYPSDDKDQVLRDNALSRFSPPRSVNPAVPRALEAIVCRAMQQHPANRYATAVELANDIEHFLADEPVSVYREPAWERWGRWARRNRGTVAVAGLFLIALALGSIVAAVLIRRTERQRFEEYRYARSAVIDTTNFIKPYSYNFIDTWPIEFRQGEQIVDAARAAQELTDRQRSDRALQRGAAILTRYAANYHRGVSQFSLAQSDFERAERELDQLLIAPDTTVDPQQLMIDRAQLRREHAYCYFQIGDLTEARKGLDAAHQLASQLPFDREVNRARILVDRAEVCLTSGDFEQADRDARDSVELMQQGYVDWKDPNPQRPLILVRAMNIRAQVARNQADLEQALEHHDDAIQRIRLLQEQRTIGNRDIRYYMAVMQTSKCQTWVRDPTTEPKQERNLGGAIQELTAVSNAFTWIPAFPAAIAQAKRLLGELFLRQERKLEECEPPLQAARTAQETLVRDYPNWVAQRRELTLSYKALAGLYTIHERPKDAAHYRDLAKKELAEVQRQSPQDFSARNIIFKD